MQRLSRRQFIGRSLQVSAAAWLAGLSFPGLAPGIAEVLETGPVDRQAVAENSWLVTWASAFGSTEEIALRIALTLRNAGRIVHTAPMTEIDSIDAYSCVVLGAPIQYDRWMKEARVFAHRHREALQERHVAGFFSCLTLSHKGPAAQRKAESYAGHIADQLPGVKAEEVGAFAGVLDTSRMGLPTRLLIRGIMNLMGVAEGDYRDWERIQAWSSGHGSGVLAQGA